MPDININPNISLGIKQQDSLTGLSNLLNMANAAQQYRQAQQINPLQVQGLKQTVEQGGYTTEKAAQENKERVLTQEFLSNPDNWQTDGRIDINKLNLNLPKIAPLTGDATISRLTALGEAQTKGIAAKQNLDTSQRALIAGPLDILGRLGIEDKEKYINELDLLKKKNPKNKDLHDLIDAQKTIIEQIPKGTSLSQMAIRGSQELLTPESKEAAFAPKAGTLDTNAGIVQTTLAPSIGGMAPKITVGEKLIEKQLPPGAKETIETDPTTGNKVIVQRDTSGRVIGTRPVPSGMPEISGGKGKAETPVSSNMPTMQYPKRDWSQPQLSVSPAEKAQYDSGFKFTKSLQDQAANLTTTKRNLDEVIKEATGLQEGTLPSSGVLGAWVRNVKNWAGDPTYRQLSKDLANVQISQIKSAGGSMDTVAGQSLAKYANGDETYPPEVLISIAKRTYADIRNTEMQAQAATRFSQKFGEANIPTFKELWAKNADSKLFELMNLEDSMAGLEGEEKKKVEKQMELLIGANKEKAKALREKYKNLKNLTEKGEL